MRTMGVVALVALLGGCSTSANDQAQVATLRKQVVALSQQVQALTTRARAATVTDLQTKCAAEAGRAFSEQFKYADQALGQELLVPSYTDHYNTTLGRCFTLVTVAKLGADVPVSETLSDPIGHIDYAEIGYSPKTGDLIGCRIYPSGKPLGPVNPCTQAAFDHFVAQIIGASVQQLAR